jgi:phage FluMu protein gp41
MDTFTFEVIKRNTDQDNLYDIFSKSVVDKPIKRKKNVVLESEDGRLDIFSKRIYGTKKYVEELMMINNIINPFSVKSGDELSYVDYNNITAFRETEKDDKNVESVTNPKRNKNTRKDSNRDKGVPPTIRPADFEQILVDKKNKTIKLNTRLQ